MKKFNKSIIFMASLLISGFAYADFATPTKYDVTLSSVSMHKSDAAASSFTTYASGSTDVNIASVSAGQPCGRLEPTGELTPGSYDQFRFVISRSMVVTGQTTGDLANGHPCRTVTGGALITDPYGDGSISEAYLGEIDGAAGTPETVIIPTGTGVVLPTGFETIGSNFQVTLPMSMNVAGSVPQGTISFDVTSSVQFEVLDATHCLVFPGPPTINLNVA
jgi:hypothetical protein